MKKRINFFASALLTSSALTFTAYASDSSSWGSHSSDEWDVNVEIRRTNARTLDHYTSPEYESSDSDDFTLGNRTKPYVPKNPSTANNNEFGLSRNDLKVLFSKLDALKDSSDNSNVKADPIHSSPVFDIYVDDEGFVHTIRQLTVGHENEQLGTEENKIQGMAVRNLLVSSQQDQERIMIRKLDIQEESEKQFQFETELLKAAEQGYDKAYAQGGLLGGTEKAYLATIKESIKGTLAKRPSTTEVESKDKQIKTVEIKVPASNSSIPKVDPKKAGTLQKVTKEGLKVELLERQAEIISSLQEKINIDAADSFELQNVVSIYAGILAYGENPKAQKMSASDAYLKTFSELKVKKPYVIQYLDMALKELKAEKEQASEKKD